MLTGHCIWPTPRPRMMKLNGGSMCKVRGAGFYQVLYQVIGGCMEGEGSQKSPLVLF